MDILPKEINYDYEVNLLRQLTLQKIELDNRRLQNVPLSADKYIVNLSRERYETLIDLAIECLKERINKNDPND